MKLTTWLKWATVILMAMIFIGGWATSHIVRGEDSTWHVATDGSDITGDGSEANPFATIQHGIDMASDGDTVLVHPGVYEENINFLGKKIVVGSLLVTTDDEDYILQTIIDGNRNDHVVTFASGEAATARLSGFTITNGYAHGDSSPGYHGGGIFCLNSNPTLTHLKVSGNETTNEGGGLFFDHCSSTVQDVVVTNNLAGRGGGGIRYSYGSVSLENVMVAHNLARGDGAGVVFYHAEGTVRNALIADNSGGAKGGGLMFDGCSPTFVNVTVVGNWTAGHGGGLNVSYMSQPTLVNSIVWGNSPEQIYFDTDWPGEAVTIEYSDIQGGEAGIVTNGQGPVYWGDGNMDASPRFVNIGLGNYHLGDDSPCLNAGKAVGAPVTDIEGNPRPDPAGSNPDIGAYENPLGFTDTISFTRIITGDIVNDPAYSSGACWGDYDDDGWLDLFVANWAGENNFLYHNNGDGGFTKITSGSIANDHGWSRGCTWGDYDNDGYLDLFVSNDGGGNFLYHNEGGASFIRVFTGPIAQDGGNCYGTAWVDYDNDGWLDLFVARHTNADNLLYHNLGDGIFEKIIEGEIVSDGGYSVSASPGDYDGDGCVDLFVGNVNNQHSFLYHNNCNGTFVKITDSAITTDDTYSNSSNWVDYDNDQDLDLFVANVDKDNFLYRNDGDGAFTRILTSVIVTEGDIHDSSWADLDNDGDEDLYMGAVGTNHRLYQNGAGGTFTPISGVPIVEDSGSEIGIWGDYDSDGDLDLFVTRGGGLTNFLYRNETIGNHWINIKLVGTVSNRSAIGARVTATGSINGVPVGQVRKVSGSTGGFGQDSLNVEFGLGDAEIIDSFVIEWPSGIAQIWGYVTVDQFMTIIEPSQWIFLPLIWELPLR